jgi:hypothetical protein
LKYDNQSQNNVGLFAEAEGAVISKLGIEKAYIVGNADVGAIVGNAKGCTISECYVADSYVAGRDHVGSIVGAMRTYTPEGQSPVFTTISNCYASGEVYSREHQAAGIAGIIAGGTLEKCYFSGYVHNSNARATGIVSLVDSDDPGEVKNNINLAAAVYGQQHRRIGEWDNRGPEGSNIVKFINNWSIEKSYFGSDLKNSSTKQGTSENDDRDGRNLSNDNLARTQSFYTGTLGWDFTNTWKFIPNTEGKMYPVLKWQTAPLVSAVYGIPEPPYLTYYPGSDEYIDLDKIIGTHGQAFTFNITEGSQYVERDGHFLYITETPVTKEGWTKMTVSQEAALNSILSIAPKYLTVNIEILLNTTVFNVSTPQELIDVNKKLFTKFRLTKDIDMAGVSFPGIGSSLTPFTGEFNGNGFSVINLQMSGNGDKKGFFNATNGAKIEKLGLANLSITGNDVVGGLVGECRNTTIDQCYVTGTISANKTEGGLMGYGLSVTVTNSYVDATITGSEHAGGLIGENKSEATITNCYFDGNVSSRYWDTGGIIALIQVSGPVKLTGTVSIGDISGERTGYQIGEMWHDVPVTIFKNNLFNTFAVNSWTNNDKWQPGVGDDLEAAIGKTDAQLKQQVTYNAIGWDFNTIWTIEEGAAYPQLKNVKYTTSTGIQPVTTETNSYKVYASDNRICVSGIEQAATVTLYNVNGQLLSEAMVGDKAVLPVANKGFYVVRITENGKATAFKVINK